MRWLRAWIHNLWRYRKFSGISDNAIMNPCGVVSDDARQSATSLTVPHQAQDQTACERGEVAINRKAYEAACKLHHRRVFR